MQNIIKTPNYKFILSEKDKKVELTAVDNTTLEMFQSQQIELHQISPTTISAALKQQNKHIKYQLERTETSILMTIEVDFDFLPKIIEKITLNIMQKEESHLNIQLQEMTEELLQLERRFKQKIYTKLKIQDVQKLPAEYAVSEGTHIIQISGLILEEYVESGYGDHIKSQANMVYQIYQEKTEKQMKCIQQKSVAIYMCSHDGNEFPFKITFIAKLQYKGKVVFKFDPATYHLNGGLLTIITQ